MMSRWCQCPRLYAMMDWVHQTQSLPNLQVREYECFKLLLATGACIKGVWCTHFAVITTTQAGNIWKHLPTRYHYVFKDLDGLVRLSTAHTKHMFLCQAWMCYTPSHLCFHPWKKKKKNYQMVHTMRTAEIYGTKNQVAIQDMWMFLSFWCGCTVAATAITWHENFPPIGLKTVMRPLFSNGSTMLVRASNFLVNGTLGTRGFTMKYHGVSNGTCHPWKGMAK